MKVQRGGGDVGDAPALRPPARLPLLLVAVQLAAFVKRARALDRDATDGHVRPHACGTSARSDGPKSSVVIGGPSRPHIRKR